MPNAQKIAVFDRQSKPPPPVLVQIVAACCLAVVAALIYVAYGVASGSLNNTELKRMVEECGELHVCRLELRRLSTSGGAAADLAKCQVDLERAHAGKGCTGSEAASGSPATATATAAEGLKEQNVDDMDMAALKAAVLDLRALSKRLLSEKAKLESQLTGQPNMPNSDVLSQKTMEETKRLLASYGTQPVSVASSASCNNITAWKGYECRATDAELQRYLNYTPRAICPNDWYFVQKLMFAKDCFSLPRRRCLSLTPARPQEPLPRPQSLFDQRALMDSNVRWDLHQCKSFECLNSRQVGDCRNCFNLTLEERRWRSEYRGSRRMADVIAMKSGSLRLGLDAGGGTGSFAAHMARFNVTVMTTAFNMETVTGRKAGLPYMESIALRGLIPLHVPHKARLPIYDGTLDIIHSVNSIKYLQPLEFEELIFEWDRVLRPGGLLWFEMFYAPVVEMPLYVQLVELLGYKKLYWNFTPKPDAGERDGEHVYLNCVLEKPPRPGTETLDGPPEVDVADM